jgi:hypothetical protein
MRAAEVDTGTDTEPAITSKNGTDRELTLHIAELRRFDAPVRGIPRTA